MFPAELQRRGNERSNPKEDGEFYALFQSRYVDMLRLAQSLFWSYRIHDYGIEPAELVSECFIELRQKARSVLLYKDAQQIMNLSRSVMQNILADRVRRGVADERRQVELEGVEFFGFDPDDKMIALNDALTKLAVKNPDLCSVVEYRYFGGFSISEIANILQISPRTVTHHCTKARRWLAEELRVTNYEQALPKQHITPSSPIRLITFTKKLYDWLLENPTRLRSFSDDDFERLVADRLAAMGLSVQRVGNVYNKDGGVDLLAWPDRSCSFPFLLAAQVKHHRGNRKTGVSDIRDFHGVLTSRGSHFHLGLIVTNTSFSADAQWFASNNSKLLRLRDLSDLCRWMRDDFLNEFEWREIPNYIELAPGVTIEIPKQRLWTPSFRPSS